MSILGGIFMSAVKLVSNSQRWQAANHRCKYGQILSAALLTKTQSNFLILLERDDIVDISHASECKMRTNNVHTVEAFRLKRCKRTEIKKTTTMKSANCAPGTESSQSRVYAA